MRKFLMLATFVATLASLGTSASLPASAENQFLFDVMKTPAYRHAWIEMLAGAKGLPPWIGQITGKNNYVATPGTTATIGGSSYRLFHACEAHNCGGSQFEVIFTADGNRAFGMLKDENHPTRWFGAPDAQIQGTLTEAMGE
jgi:hypothetical protein